MAKPPTLASIALLGATGNVGSRLLAEALARGHRVTGIARHVESLSARPNLTPVAVDMADEAALAPALVHHDVVLSAVKFLMFDPNVLLTAVRKAGVPRLLMVGGAGSLEVAPDKRRVDAPDFPPQFRAEALAGADALDTLRRQRSVNWTMLCPSDEFVRGERTGVFRLGGDQMLIDAQGRSWISQEDFAIAMLDELETPRHPRQRFTVGY